MDAIIILSFVFILVAAIVPLLLMRGQFGKPKRPQGKQDGSDGSATLPLLFGADGGGKGKSHGNDTDGGGGDSSGGGGDGGGGGGE